MPLVVLAVAFLSALTAAEIKELNSTADQLDELVSQNKVLTRTTTRPGHKTKREILPPLSVAIVAQVAGEKLNLSTAELTPLLKNDRERLSEVVLAKALESPEGPSWKELLKKNSRTDLFRLAEERQVTSKVKTLLDDLYADISLTAMDHWSGDAVGRAPAAVSGKGKVRTQPGKEGKRRE